MNKVVALLAVIVLITLGGLLFCAGFFTGTAISPVKPSSTATSVEKNNNEKKIAMKDVDEILDTKSASISDKIMNILSSAADSAGAALSKTADKDSTGKKRAIPQESHISVDSLLREIAATHRENDDCSYQKTVSQIQAQKQAAEKNLHNLHGKKIVFVGYFKNKIALQIQRLLISRGYKAHVEQSKSVDSSESFVFCGPFKREKHANVLVEWLLKHDFSEARSISISKDVVEETLYESIGEDSSMPVNVEKMFQEMDSISQNQTPTPQNIQQTAAQKQLQMLQQQATENRNKANQHTARILQQRQLQQNQQRKAANNPQLRTPQYPTNNRINLPAGR